MPSILVYIGIKICHIHCSGWIQGQHILARAQSEIVSMVGLVCKHLPTPFGEGSFIFQKIYSIFILVLASEKN